MPMKFAPPSADDIPLYLLSEEAFGAWQAEQPGAVANWIAAMGFTPKTGSVLVVPGDGGAPLCAIAGDGTDTSRARERFTLAAAAQKLPAATYRLATPLDPVRAANEALGWLLQGYHFDRYRAGNGKPVPVLAEPEGIDTARVEAIAEGEALTRDLINTPASHMGPADLEAAARELAQTFGASVDVVKADALIDRNFPMIHAVGRASPRAPRLIEVNWGTAGPKLTLVGKGVCFDTGGLNLKPGNSMGLMKKDMGGAATVLGLARMIMSQRMPLRLRVLIPAVENSVGGGAFRPQDILTSRKGLTVEINNTDAEGRLVLADALAFADEDDPDLIVSMATLTGAARVAVGPDLAPFFTGDAGLAAALEFSAGQVADPVWRLPFHDPYETMIEPGIADLDNAPKGGFAGAITAALFLRRFVTGCPRYIHFDIYGWQPSAAPARPKGGVGQGARALLHSLPEVLGL